MSLEILQDAGLTHEVEAVEKAHGRTVYRVHPEDLFLAVRTVLESGYRILSCLSAYETKDAFGVFYAFVRPANTSAEFGEVRLEVLLPKKDEEGQDVEPRVPSITGCTAAANWHEREMYDMYGIHFEGHPDLRRIFLPEGWIGFPMRKDYAEDEQFVAMQDGEDVVLPVREEGSW